MKLFDVYPIQDIIIEQGSGPYIWDEQGDRYLDFYGGHAVISIGHCHPHYVATLKDQLDRLGFYSNSIRIPLQQELADKLGRICEKEDYQLFLCNSGAEANENALKLASFHTGRKKAIAFKGAFHGRTSLAVAATDNPSIVAPINQTDNIIFLDYNQPQQLIACFEKQGKDIAAVIIEGIQGVGGIIEAEASFLQLIRELCNQYGAIYIADSVQCGYGRSGKFFSHDYAGVDADIYTMAKGMGNGFPVAGLLISPKIRPVYGMLGTTFGGNHLACAAAIAVLDVMKSEQLIQAAATTGSYLKEKLSQITKLRNVRGKGLMIGFDAEGPLAHLRKQLLAQHRIFTGEAKPSTVRLLPPLNIGTERVDMLVQAIHAIIHHSNEAGS